jgi:hypothetical protein
MAVIIKVDNVTLAMPEMLIVKDSGKDKAGYI